MGFLSKILSASTLGLVKPKAFDNIGQDLFGGSTTTTDIQKRTDPGIFGASPESTRLAGRAENILGTEPDLLSMLRNELMNPSFAPQTSSEQSILSSIMDLAGGRSASRGLGAPTMGGLAQSIAPTLADMRNQRVNNLSQALGLEQGFRGQTLGGLMELGGMAMPQNMYIPTQNTQQTAGILPALTGLAGGIGGLSSGLGALGKAGGLSSLFK